jgi:ATP-binding cassette subfamily F protein uup
MNVLSVENLSKSYGEKALFDKLSFAISEKQRIGLIGVNGTGKSSLLKIIAGIEEADQGKIIHANDFRVELLPQNPMFNHQCTILEQVFFGESPLMQVLREYEQALNDLQADSSDQKNQARLLTLQQRMDALNAWEANTYAKSILNRLGIQNYHRQIGELSGGQRKRVAMASALIQPADLLILDEPTNHIDNETIEWLEEFLSHYKGALLLVTHDRYFLNRVTNRILELDRGKLYSYAGNYEYFLEKRSEREEQESAKDGKTCSRENWPGFVVVQRLGQRSKRRVSDGQKSFAIKK